jgi:outer membrane protein TolC
VLPAATLLSAFAQNLPQSYSIATPRPISPAENSTNPSAQATQGQNPYLGSVPARATGGILKLSLGEALDRGLHYNLGLVESNRASADVHAERLRALSALLPQISAHAEQGFESISFAEIGLKLPPAAGFRLPQTTGGFGYQDARVAVTSTVYDRSLIEQLHARKNDELASALSIKDSRDVVVLAVGTAYFQVIASEARVETAKAALAAITELDRLTANRVASEVSPEIDSLRAQVERQSAEQRLTDVTNELEKDKLTLARITGLSVDQKIELTESLMYRPLTGITIGSATEEALRSRADLASAEASVRAAEATLREKKSERLPVISASADYGAGGGNFGNASQVYSLSGKVTVPIYTGGRIHADIEQAQSDLARRQAEYEDLKGRIAYDVRVAWLDVTASDSSVKVAARNATLANRALAQSRDRYTNGVTNFLEVVEAEQVVAGAGENYVQSLYSYNIACISLARAIGGAETRLRQLLGEERNDQGR